MGKRKVDGWKCPACEKVLRIRKELYKHIKEVHIELKGTNNQYTRAKALGLPKPVISDETRRKLSEHHPKSYSEETKRKVSEGMKKAHAEGRAWNIGKSRWNNKPSYPEQWMMKVIENEFQDKEYVREFPCGIYSIDFAWVNKKRAIEIDGEQHQRFEEYQARDERKNKKMTEEGWSFLRFSWKEICNNTKICIQKMKIFVET
jgi:very-short-patch-repair endonuclease